MKKHQSIFVPLLLLMLVTSCKTPYQLKDVQRSRIVVDKTYDAMPNPEVDEFMKPFRHVVDSQMSPVVGRAACYMAAARPESNLSNLLADILVWAAKNYNEQPALSIYNMGGIRAGFAEGNVTYGDVLDVAPFDNKICFLTLTGEKLMELFRQIASTHGQGVSKSVRLVITADGQLVDAKVDGKDIDPAASYRIATLDYLAQGNDNLSAFKSATNLVSPQDERNNARFIIIDYFRAKAAEGKAVEAAVEGRIVEKE